MRDKHISWRSHKMYNYPSVISTQKYIISPFSVVRVFYDVWNNRQLPRPLRQSPSVTGLSPSYENPRSYNCSSLIEMYSRPYRWHYPRTSRALFHSKNNVILVTLREREILIGVVPLFVVPMTLQRFHSSYISLVPKRVRDCSSLIRGTGSEKNKRGRRKRYNSQGNR